MRKRVNTWKCVSERFEAGKLGKLHWPHRISFTLYQHSVGRISKIRSSAIGIIGDQDIGDELNSVLNAMGFDKVKLTSDPDLLLSANMEDSPKILDMLVVTSWGLDLNFFYQINKKCHENGIRFFCVAIEGEKGLLGPTVIPFQSPCIACLKSRNLSHDGFIPDTPDTARMIKNRSLFTPFKRKNPLVSVLCSEAAMEITRFLTGIAPPATIGGVFEYNGLSPMPTRHNFFKLPRCPGCWTKTPAPSVWNKWLPLASNFPIIDESSPALETCLERAFRLISPKYGLINSVEFEDLEPGEPKVFLRVHSHHRETR